MSLSFLGKKSFHPSNPKNLKKLFEAEEKKSHEEKRAEQLRLEHEQEETRRANKKMLGGGSSGQAEAPVATSFMYQPPPGLREAQQRQRNESEQTRAQRDVEKFPLLKNAPVQGEYTDNIAVHHRPFGVALRNTRCTKCGQWGHQLGDRECPMRTVLTDKDEASKAAADPFARAVAGSESDGAPLRWVPKAAMEQRRHGTGAGASSSDANQQYVAVADEDELLAAAGVAEMAAAGELDPHVMAMLTEKQQRQLRKMYQKELRAEDGGGGDDEQGRRSKKHKHDKEKKHRKKEKHHSSHKEKKASKKEKRRHRDSGSGSSDSDSD